MCDIDHFKRFNDSYGHDVGDIVLKEVARIIKQTAPRGAVVGRYGGEEFVVAMNITSTSQLRRFAEAIRLAVSEKTIAVNDTVLHLTISLGGAVGNYKKMNDIMTLLKQADENLYEAKEKGRNRSIVK